jgi:O-acetyl-ADP-ribose deacetylase (regulator of RNase III)
MAEICERFGNIFDSARPTIVNTVNTAGVMGRGIALEFRYRYPEMFADYQQKCKAGIVRIGELSIWKRSSPWIINFPTKTDWKLPSKYDYVEAGLRRFATFYRQEGIHSIAFPPLGASLGGLDWERVKALMWQWLEPLPDLSVEVVRFDESASDKWFDALCANTRGWSRADFQSELGLPKAQATLVSEALDSGQCCQMMQLQGIKGLGERSVEKLYEFVRAHMTGGPAPSRGLFGE